MFNARKTYKIYIYFSIFSLYFVAVICEKFRFSSLLRFCGHYYKLQTSLVINLMWALFSFD